MSKYAELKKQTGLLEQILAVLKGSEQEETASETKTVNYVRHETKSETLTFEEIQEKAIAGEIQVGDQIVLEFDGKPVAHDVIGINVDKPVVDNPDDYMSITIQMHDLVAEERTFDEKDSSDSNVWETSGIRAYLNSNDFRKRYTDLPGKLAKVQKENNSGDDTVDTFFLLSIDEINVEKTLYPFYKNARNKVKFNEDDETDWHWTRSAIRGHATNAWYVHSTGGVNGSYSSGAYRFAPACVLIFKIK